MPAKDFSPYSNILIDAMVYLGAGGPVMNSPNVDKRITTVAININLNSYIENIKNRTLHYKHYRHFTSFQKNIINITNRTKKLSHASKKRKSY